MKQWFIQIEDKEKTLRLTVYDNGLVYGTNKGQKLYVLTSQAMKQLKDIINPNLYMFKTLEYYKDSNEPTILKVNDKSRKQRRIKVVGWKQLPKIINILKDSNNYVKVF